MSINKHDLTAIIELIFIMILLHKKYIDAASMECLFAMNMRYSVYGLQVITSMLVGAVADVGYLAIVNITTDMASADVKHKGNIIRIEHEQDKNALIDPGYTQTSRPHSPYCINAMRLAEGVLTFDGNASKEITGISGV